MPASTQSQFSKDHSGQDATGTHGSRLEFYMYGIHLEAVVHHSCVAPVTVLACLQLL